MPKRCRARSSWTAGNWKTTAGSSARKWRSCWRDSIPMASPRRSRSRSPITSFAPGWRTGLSSNSGERGKRPVVLCAGITVEDFIFKVERFPAPGEKLHAESLLAITGGCAANAAVAVARLGGIARFAGPVGTDDASRRIIAGLTQAGVDVSGVERVEGGSVSVSGIFIDGTGE